ncbi:MAG: hypothetical protein KF732_04585 [Flavobacteriales bacterium]|nr:hypothetical protein [Flavobacteriales bacterium]
MQELIKILFSKRKILLILIFVFAFITRLYLIYNTPYQNESIDLNIYRDGGQLITNGINPYNYSDKIDIRNQLRLDSIAFNVWICETQERWDFYASSNLPLSLLFYGLIDSISDGNSTIYRIFFDIIDALLALVIALILLRFWKLNPSFINLILLLGAGALSPTLLLWGAIFPEDKGLQILLMLLAILLAIDRKWFLSSIFLGCSIAFKGLGVFIIPLCLFFLINENQKIHKSNKKQFKLILLYLSLTFFFSIIWFLPYMPEIFEMMKKRIEMNLGSEVIPEHGSIWVIVMNIFPNKWEYIKTFSIAIISILWGYAFLFRKVNIPALSLFILVLFVDILLLKGSMDRMNIGLIVSMVFFSFIDIKYARILGWYTIIIGFYLYYPLIRQNRIDESVDGIYTMGYLILFCLYPLFTLFDKKIELPT